MRSASTRRRVVEGVQHGAASTPGLLGAQAPRERATASVRAPCCPVLAAQQPLTLCVLLRQLLQVRCDLVLALLRERGGRAAVTAPGRHLAAPIRLRARQHTRDQLVPRALPHALPPLVLLLLARSAAGRRLHTPALTLGVFAAPRLLRAGLTGASNASGSNLLAARPAVVRLARSL